MPAQRPAQAFVPSRYYAMLLDVLAERGHARADLLRLAGVATEALVSDEGYLTLLQVEALVGRACALENTDALGLEVGKRLQLMSHGSLSMAAFLRFRFRLAPFLVRMWRSPCFLYLIFPLAVFE